MDQDYICMLIFGYFEMEDLKIIGDAIGHEFMMPVIFRGAHIDLSEMYHIERRQYDGNRLLAKVNAMKFPASLKTIGLFNVDIYVPILTYIFGQAMLGGSSGIASSYRLNNALYGLPKDETLLLERVKKEVIHELGHTFGLIHCHYPNCVMASSTYVEDIDQKSVRLCNNCRKNIGLD